MPEENNQTQTNKIYGVRTLKTDTVEVEHNPQTSLSKIFLKQEKTTGWPADNLISKRKIIYFVGAGLLLLITTGGIIFWLLQKKPATPPMTDLIPPTPIVISQKINPLNADSVLTLKTSFEEALRTNNPIGDLIYTPITKTDQQGLHYLNTQGFFDLLAPKTQNFLSIFLQNNFYLGILNMDKNRPILIFEISPSKYENAFGAMLTWEKQMLNDLSFIVDKDNVLEGAPLSFKDKIIKNQTARVVESEKGIIFLYSVFNKKYIIITDSAIALEEMVHQFVAF